MTPAEVAASQAAARELAVSGPYHRDVYVRAFLAGVQWQLQQQQTTDDGHVPPHPRDGRGFTGQ